MQLTVLGSGAACPAGGQNSSGYLVETAERRVLLDCGHGVTSALLARRPAADIDDIFVSHMHADHFIDILALRFRITRDMSGLPAEQSRVSLHLPPGGRDRLRAILEAVTFPEDFCANTFTVEEYAVDSAIALGDLSLTASAARHYIPGYAFRLETGEGADQRSLAYSGDTAPSPGVTALARDCDLFLCEATLDEPEDREMIGHCTPEQAARMAAEAGAKRLVLTHFWFGTDTAAIGERARAAGPVPVDIASDGLQITI
jgi:ribonuclease BN (tRNA processing enzyme)